MAISTQTQNLNLIPGKSAPVVVHCSQGNVGDTVQFYLYDGDEPYYPTNVSIAVHGVRADGSVFGPYAVTVTSGSNLVSFELVTAMTSVNGAAIGELVITDSSENQVGSANFGILVEATPYSSSVTYEDDLSIYQRILAYVQSIPAELQGEIDAVAASVRTESAERTATDEELSESISTLNTNVGTLTSDLASETSARQNADSALSTRIDQIVAPSGGAPSASEVTDARIGYDSAVYTSLGRAIRSQTKIIENSVLESIGVIDLKASLGFVVGYMDGSGNVDTSRRFRVSTRVSFYLDKDIIILKPANVYIWITNETSGAGTQLAAEKDGFIIKGGSTYRISMAALPMDSSLNYTDVYDMVGYSDVRFYYCDDVTEYFRRFDSKLKNSNLWRIGNANGAGEYVNVKYRLYQPVPKDYKEGVVAIGRPGSFIWMTDSNNAYIGNGNASAPWYLHHTTGKNIRFQLAEFPMDTSIVYNSIYDTDLFNAVEVYTDSDIKAICRSHPATIDDSVMGVAHRGLAGAFPENTLPAYEESADMGNFVWETDIKRTSDGVLVCCHDATINSVARNADGSTISDTITIADTTYADLLNYDFGIYKGQQFAGTKILKFDDLVILAIKKNATIQIDGFEPSVVSDIFGILNSRAFKKYMFSCFTAEQMDEVLTHDSNAKLIKLYSQTPTTSGIQTDLASYKDNVFCIELYTEAATAEIAQWIIAEGYRFGVYNVDNMAALKTYLDMGATVICSNILQVRYAIDAYYEYL